MGWGLGGLQFENTPIPKEKNVYERDVSHNLLSLYTIVILSVFNNSESVSLSHYNKNGS